MSVGMFGVCLGVVVEWLIWRECVLGCGLVCIVRVVCV